MALRVIPAQLNTVLERFYAGTAEDDALTELVGLVRESIRVRLLSRISEREVVDDLQAEAVARLCVGTRNSRGETGNRITNYQSYALTVADSVFEDYLRRVRPNWYRLKRRIVYLLDGRGGGTVFGRWRSNADWLGGLSRWRGQPFRRTQRFRLLVEQPDLFAQEALPQELTHMELPELLCALFRWLETPVEVNTLTTQVGVVQGLEELSTVNLDTVDTTGSAKRHYSSALVVSNPAEEVLCRLSTEDLRNEVWKVLCELPIRQRMSLLLGLEREEILVLGSVSAMSVALELPFDDIVVIWRMLPYSDTQIGNRLEITPKQVSNLRKCARERLWRWLKKIL